MADSASEGVIAEEDHAMLEPILATETRPVDPNANVVIDMELDALDSIEE